MNMLQRPASLLCTICIVVICTVFQYALLARKESFDQESLLELTSNKVRLQNAARKGDIGTVQLILENAIDIHPFDKDQACIIACEHGHIQIVELLIKCNDCNIQVRNGALLKIAVQNGDVTMVRLLLDAVMRLGKYPFSLTQVDNLLNFCQEKSGYTLLDWVSCRYKRKGRFKAITALLYAYCRQMRARVSRAHIKTAIEILVERIITNDPERVQQVAAFVRDYLKNQLTDAHDQYCVNKIYEGIAIGLTKQPSGVSSFEEINLEVE